MDLMGGLLLAFFFVVGAFSLTALTHALTRLGETRSLEIIAKHPRRFFYYSLHRSLFHTASFELLLLSSRLGENLAKIGYVVMALLTLSLFFSASIPLLVLLALVWICLLLVAGEFLPRLWAVRNPESALATSFRPASCFLFLFLPFSLLFLKCAELATRFYEKAKGGGDSIEEVKEMIVQILRSTGVKGPLNSADKKLIESVVKFKDRIVREVMVPRIALFSVTADMPIRQAAKELVKEGYSRTPVYRDTIDNIIGVLMFKDILQLYMDCLEGKKERELLEGPVETLVKSVFYTPETKKVAHLLQEFRSKQMHMAIVVDEYGGTEGVVTMEDILEEIVGEIADEYDEGEELLYKAQPGGKSWIVDARMNILDAEEIFGIHIPQEGEYDTIGGYIFHKIGSIPQAGLRVTHSHFEIEILNSSARSIDKVKITLQKP